MPTRFGALNEESFERCDKTEHRRRRGENKEVLKYREFIARELTPEDGENLMWRTIAGVLGV